MMTTDITTLLQIKNDLSLYHRDRNSVLKEQIQGRLNESFRRYTTELNHSLDYLRSRSELNVAKKLNKKEE